ncbi:gliding motility-associated C-terminal domain-containing protein [Pedobacter sp. BMA]|uniref:gliding motility-associated C-terminal domain-containing protein n=1 Tax=Pedobacter sp. BMA TaxID=1663685 RepID=UPI00064AD4AE|nr:T9SS C-terminal target domain-containing protein [Pedobacter sp. BMA]KLT66125.1 hypothetical protein AB669_08140 [Pedobacter sp. BMA]
MRNIGYLFIIPFVWGCLATEVKAQSLPYTINAANGSAKISNQFYDFSVGEMVLVQTFQTGSVSLTQGFLQPFLVIETAANIAIMNNILTPNGDGKNDYFVVKGIENYPSARLSIFDRGGRLLYVTTGYQNNWDGYVNGNPLAEDTYYYLLDLGAGGTIKGFISILYKK